MWLGGPFVGLNDSFVECPFSLLEASLGYDVLPSVNFIAKPFRFNDSSPSLRRAPIDGERYPLRIFLKRSIHADSKLHDSKID